MNSIQKTIFRYLLDEVCSESSRIGTRLPTELQLAGQFGTTRVHAGGAMRELVAAGLVVRNKKQGSLIARKPNPLERSRLYRLLSMKLCVINYSRSESRYIHWNDRIRETLGSVLAKNGIEMEEHLIGDTPSLFNRERIDDLIRDSANCILVVPGETDTTRLLLDVDAFFHSHDRIFIFERASNLWNPSFCNVVGINNFADGIAAGELALSGGARHIVFCQTESEAHWAAVRREGVRKGVMRKSGGRMVMETFSYGLNGAFPYLSPDGSTVLITETDPLAVKLIEAGRLLGKRVGKEFRIISFGDDSRCAEYRITSFSPALEVIGSELGRRIADVMNKRDPLLTTQCQVASTPVMRSTF